MKTCGTCAYCWTPPRINSAPNAKPECRKNPPMAQVIQAAQGVATLGVWPPVLHEQGCGEHKTREDLQRH